MDKILLSSDWHFGKSNGRFDEIIYNGIIEQCDYAKKHNIKIMINLGDTFDIKQTISLSTLNLIAKAMDYLNDTFDKIYILVGNHDMSKKTFDSKGHNLHILKGYSNIEIIDNDKDIEIYNKRFYFMPYLPNELIKKHSFKEANYLMGHIEVQGFMLNQFVAVEDGVTPKKLGKYYDQIFLGHFHKKQSKDNIHYIGNICRFFYGENDDPRGWTVLNVDDGSFEFIEYNHPSLFKCKLSELLEDDIIFDSFKPGDNLKLVIDKRIKFSELEELKSELTLTYKINELLLDDQFYAFDMDDIDDDDIDDETETNLDPTFAEYLLKEITKVKENVSNEVLTYLEDKSKEFQE